MVVERVALTKPCFMETAATAGLVVFASLWGTLTRLGLVALNTYDGESVAPTVWAQAVGCLVMGWATYPRNKAVLERWYKPTSTMITTGYCGSSTSYSSWVAEVFEAFANYSHHQRHGLHNVMDALTQTGVTVGMSFAAFWGGRCLGSWLCLESIEHWRPSRTTKAANVVGGERGAPGANASIVAHTGSLALGLVFWVGAALLCGLYAPFRHVTYALVLAPPGALLRWQLARLNPVLHPEQRLRWYAAARWPWGTLSANLLAVLIYGAADTAQYVGRITGPSSLGAYTHDACDALYGLQNGFCGTLSTVSTLVAELVAMRPPRAAFSYLFFSWAMGVVLALLLIGAPWWCLGHQGGCTRPV